MKTLTLLITLVFTIQLLAQDPILQKDNEVLERIATSITNTYNKELSLGAKQFILFEKKVEEFLIREDAIHRTYKGKEKLDLIYKLRKAESLEIRNILTQVQFNFYERIKPQIQPLAVIDTVEDQ